MPAVARWDSAVGGRGEGGWVLLKTVPGSAGLWFPWDGVRMCGGGESCLFDEILVTEGATARLTWERTGGQRNGAEARPGKADL